MLFITECKEEMLEEKSTLECFNYTYRSLSHICDAFHCSVFDFYVKLLLVAGLWMYYDSQGVFWYGTIRCIINSGWSQCDVTNWFVRFEGSSLSVAILVFWSQRWPHLDAKVDFGGILIAMPLSWLDCSLTENQRTGCGSYLSITRQLRPKAYPALSSILL